MHKKESWSKRVNIWTFVWTTLCKDINCSLPAYAKSGNILHPTFTTKRVLSVVAARKAKIQRSHKIDCWRQFSALELWRKVCCWMGISWWTLFSCAVKNPLLECCLVLPNIYLHALRLVLSWTFTAAIPKAGRHFYPRDNSNILEKFLIFILLSCILFLLLNIP